MDRWQPQRIVCLTAETAELAFALGCGDRVAGVTGYAVRPSEVRRLPRVSAFRTASLQRILELQPDLVLGFSDLQATIASELIAAGVNVLITNQRSLEETYAAIVLVGSALGERPRAVELAEELRTELETIRPPGNGRKKPTVFFEEWDSPLISGISWASQIIELAGGEDAFPELRLIHDAPGRIVQPDEVVRRKPDIVIASWCGKKARLDRIGGRPGWAAVPAVRTGHVFEVKAPDILQPGLSLVHGARQIAGFIREWQARTT